MTTTTIGSGTDTISLGISEDAYKGDAQFTIGVDGQPVSGVLTASALHSGATSDTVNVLGNFGTGPHTVSVSFLNDLYAGTPQTDRNLYIDGATLNGAFIPHAAQELAVPGSVSFNVGSAPPVVAPAAATVAITDTNGITFKATLPEPLTTRTYYQNETGLNTNVYLYSNGAGGWIIAPSSTYNAPKIVLTTNGNPIAAAGFSSITDGSTPAILTWQSGTTEASALSPAPKSGDTLIVKTGATVLAENAQLTGVGVILNGSGIVDPSLTNAANLTLTNATVGRLAVSFDPNLQSTDLSGSHVGHLDVYGQTTIAAATTVGGGRPVGPGFLDAYVHGATGVLALHGAVVGGPSTLTVKGDAGSAVENDGTLNIQGGTTTGSIIILNNLTGAGSITGGADNTGSTATVRLGGAVGTGQTINLTQTSLLLDKPMSFQGTLAGFNAARLSGVTLSNEDITSATYAQSAPGVGTLSLATQDPTSGVAGATLAFHVAGDYAGKTFAFTNDSMGHSAFVTLAA